MRRKSERASFADDLCVRVRPLSNHDTEKSIGQEELEKSELQPFGPPNKCDQHVLRRQPERLA
jgi:hypothetical protein